MFSFDPRRLLNRFTPAEAPGLAQAVHLTRSQVWVGRVAHLEGREAAAGHVGVCDGTRQTWRLSS